jgi:hypothetical protein
MTHILIKEFWGMEPQTAPRRLHNNQAVRAQNARLWTRELQPLNGPVAQAVLTSENEVKTIFPMGSSWLQWDVDVSMTRGAVANDQHDRHYYSGDKNPKVTNTDLATGAGSTFPNAWYRLGFPVPDSVPTVGHTGGGSGSAEVRSYVYRFKSQWGEAGPPSAFGEHTGVDDATQWDISGLDAAPPNDFDLTSIVLSSGVVTATADENHFLETSEQVTVVENKQSSVLGATFDGETVMFRPSVSGAADGATGTIAFVIRVPEGALATGPMRLYTIVGSGSSDSLEIEISTAGLLTIKCRTSADVLVVDLATASGAIVEGVYYRVLADWDTATGASLYINDVDAAATATVAAGNVEYTGANVHFGGLGFPWGMGGATDDGVDFDASSQSPAGAAITFSFDGSIMIVADKPSLYQYNLSTPWLVSSAVYSGNSITISGSYGEHTFNYDGSKLYVLNSTTYDIKEFDLSTPWDLSTVVDLGKSFDASTHTPWGMTFSTNGSRLYLISVFDDKVYQYNLSVPWDITTATYSSVEFDVSSEASAPSKLQFSPDGRTLIVFDVSGDELFQYTLSTPWDLSSAAYDSVFYDLNSVIATPADFFISPGGTRLFALSTGGTVYQLTLSSKPLTGSVRGFYAYFGARVGVATGSNRLKFFLATGLWASMGADGSTPASAVPEVWLPNDYATFHENEGDGGDLEVFGSAVGAEYEETFTLLNGLSFEVTRIDETIFTFETTLTPLKEFLTYASSREAPINVNGMVKEIFRADANGIYRYVGEASGTTFTDTVASTSLGEALPDYDWIAPPGDLQQISIMDNGVLAGFSASRREVCFSEPYQPHAFPQEYRFTLGFEPTGAGVYGSSFIVGTKGRPSFFTGAHPANMSEETLDINQSCISARGVSAQDTGLVYPSPNGLVFVSGAGPILITESIIEKKNWQRYNPETLLGATFDDRYVGFYDVGGASNERGAFMFDPEERRAAFIELNIKASALYHDEENDELFYCTPERLIMKFNAHAVQLQAYFKSKTFVLPRKIHMTAAKVRWTPNGTATAEEIEAALATAISVVTGNVMANGVPTHPGTFAGFYPMQFFVMGGPLAEVLAKYSQAPVGLTFNLYVDGVLRHTETPADSSFFRIPDTYDASDEYIIELSVTQGDVHSVVVAQTASELSVDG